MGETVFFVTVIVIGIFSVGYVLGKSDERRKWFNPHLYRWGFFI